MAKPTIEQISEMSIAEAKPLIEKMSADDLAKLREMEEGKEDGKQRKGVLDAIDAAISSQEKSAEKLTLEQRVDRLEQAIAGGDPTTAAMVYAK